MCVGVYIFVFGGVVEVHVDGLFCFRGGERSVLVHIVYKSYMCVGGCVGVCIYEGGVEVHVDGLCGA